LPELQTPPNL
jgi:hypothetical protein